MIHIGSTFYLELPSINSLETINKNYFESISNAYRPHMYMLATLTLSYKTEIFSICTKSTIA